MLAAQNRAGDAGLRAPLTAPGCSRAATRPCGADEDHPVLHRDSGRTRPLGAFRCFGHEAESTEGNE